MKLVYSPSANAAKSRAITIYPNISRYFEMLERKIVEDPYCASQEKILVNGQFCTTYKRSAKTAFFSGIMPDVYISMAINYAITTDDRIVVLNVSTHVYEN
jgi:hypothetical protein